ncbi:MAG: beta-glucosidase [Magnetospirillum sp.]|nr:beta-glucosidase [Magnetospirillum sp.]
MAAKKNKKSADSGLRPDFIWGVSTSAFQVEGATKEDGRGPSIWDTRCRLQGGVWTGANADVACDHYHRWPEDVALLKDLGVDAYRFSLAWPRLLPKGKGQVNQKGLDFYDRLIDAVLEAGIQPWVRLYHWDLPQALDDQGGWTNRDCAGWFADYAVLAAKRYGDRVKHFATFNEFSVFTMFGYAIDWAAPGVTDRAAHMKAIHHVNLAHGAGVDVLRDHVPGVSIGAIHNRQIVRPEGGLEKNRAAAELLDAHWNGVFCDPQHLGHYPEIMARDIEPYVLAGDMVRICRPTDWMGLNHYGPIYAKADPATTWGYGWGNPPESANHPEVGWPIFPEVFKDELLTLTRRYNLPIYVTENGCGGGAGSDTPDENGEVKDTHRLAYFREYHQAMRDAVAEGADLRGYFVWALLDNFEWGSGYGPRFGLVHVDFETQKRTIKNSGKWYRDLIKAEHRRR